MPPYGSMAGHAHSCGRCGCKTCLVEIALRVVQGQSLLYLLDLIVKPYQAGTGEHVATFAAMWPLL